MNTSQESNVAERNRAAHVAHENEVAKYRGKLREIGLGEYMDEVNTSPWRFPVDMIICNPKDKAIACRTRWSHHIAESFNLLVGRKIELLKLSNGTESVTVFTSQDTLTLPERHTLNAMNTYFEMFYPGFACEDEWVYFPRAMEPYAIPAEYLDERDAFETAEVLSAITSLDSRVVNTTKGYSVILHDTKGRLTDWDALCVIGAVRVLERFTCTRKNKDIGCIKREEGDIKPLQKKIEERYTQQQRIEAMLTDVLARLKGDTETGLPIAAVGKSSSKRSA